MAANRKDELDEGRILESLQDIVAKIKNEEDPFLLNTYRRLFRKAGPLTLRSYFAAYFVKLLAEGRLPSGLALRGDRNARRDRGDRNDRNDRGDGADRAARGNRNDRNDRNRTDGAKNARDGDASRQDQRRTSEDRKRTRGEGREDRPAREERPAREDRSEKSEPRNVLPDDVSTTLFVGIGRNRRVFPRDIIGLILQNAAIDRDHVGDIRVLDNYSFVQVITEDAETVIAALNDIEYRGRKLVVSHSRKREEGPSRRERGEDASSSGFADASDAPTVFDGDESDSFGSDDESFDDSATFAADDAADDGYDADSDSGAADSGYGDPDLGDDVEDKSDV